MIPPSTYLEFHAVFTLPAIAVLALLTWRRGMASRLRPGGVVILVALAVAYTTPWDNLLIEQGVWWYGEDAVWATLWAAPVGEYLFFLLQPVLTLLFLLQFRVPTDTDMRLTRRERALGVAAGLAVTLVGGLFLLAGEFGLYLGSMLLWAGPILALQWGFGWTHLWRARRTVAAAVLVPMAYLWLVDYTAIQLGLWTISGTHTLGVAPLGFPVEEAVFFLVTNVFVVQGYVLYLWLCARWPTLAGSPRLVRYRRYLGSRSRAGDQEQPTDD